MISKERFERRGYNTRPLWEAAQQDIKALQERVADLEASQQHVNELENKTSDLQTRIGELQALAVLDDSAFSSNRQRVCCIRFVYEVEIHRVPAPPDITDEPFVNGCHNLSSRYGVYYVLQDRLYSTSRVRENQSKLTRPSGQSR